VIDRGYRAGDAAES